MATSLFDDANCLAVAPLALVPVKYRGMMTNFAKMRKELATETLERGVFVEEYHLAEDVISMTILHCNEEHRALNAEIRSGPNKEHFEWLLKIFEPNFKPVVELEQEPRFNLAVKENLSVTVQSATIPEPGEQGKIERTVNVLSGRFFEFGYSHKLKKVNLLYFYIIKLRFESKKEGI